MTSTSPASSQVTPQGTLPSQIALKGLLGCSAAGGAGGYPVQLAANGGLAIAVCRAQCAGGLVANREGPLMSTSWYSVPAVER